MSTFQSWFDLIPPAAMDAALNLCYTSGFFTPKDFARHMGMRGLFKSRRATKILKELQRLHIVGYDTVGSETGHWFTAHNTITQTIWEIELSFSALDTYYDCYDKGNHCRLDDPSMFERVRESVRDVEHAK